MSAKYTIHETTSPRVQELPTVSATELKNSTADVLAEVVARRAIAITRHDKPRAVLVSIAQYEALVGSAPSWLNELKQDYLGMLDQMQAPGQKAAAIRAFNATPQELGAAALAAAKRKKNRTLP